MGFIDFAALCDAYPLTLQAEKAGVKLRANGREWVGICPFHSEKSGSFTIYHDGDRQRYQCFGCNAHGDVVRFVADIYQTDLVGAATILTGGRPIPAAVKAAAPPEKPREAAMKDADKIKLLWGTSVPAAGTPVEDYLRARAIDIERIGGIPPSLRFVTTKYWHPLPNGKVECLGTYPAMIAPILDAQNAMIGVHLTYLEPSAPTKLKLVDPTNPDRILAAKKVKGQARGGCIRLGPAGPHMMMAEGIETALSVKSVIAGTRMDQPVWTFVSLGNMGRITLPAGIERLMVLADNDMKAPVQSGQRDLRKAIRDTAKEIGERNKKTRVTIAWPPLGMDFNDYLRKMVGV